MTHTLIIRGFDDQVHEQLGEIANKRGVSVNSIVKNAVDMWLKKNESEIPTKHHLVIYSDDESIIRLLKSMDRFAREGNLFRCFFGPPNSFTTELLSKLRWYDGTIKPYYYHSLEKYTEKEKSQIQTKPQFQSQKNIIKYCDKVLENVVKNADNKPVCCMDFLINDIGKNSLKQALTLEKVYDDNRIPGLMYCTYKTENLLHSQIKDLIELFEMHDQVFILKEDEVYKLHITKENVHKLFLG